MRGGEGWGEAKGFSLLLLQIPYPVGTGEGPSFKNVFRILYIQASYHFTQ